MTVASGTDTCMVGVGYEGHSIATFVDMLIGDGITHLVDVRLTPISRKPGFSKTALCHALAAAGITYIHHPELGNPKPNRAGFSGSKTELDHARRTFARWISRPEAQTALDALAELAEQTRVAVLCFEADQSRCHRDVVLARARRRHRSG